jgi:hypothetical protein
MRSVRLPILVPHLEGNARMKSAMSGALRFRGPGLAVRQVMPCGVLAISALASSGPGAGCVHRQHQLNHKVPRSRSSSARQLRGPPSSIVGAGLSVSVGGVRRCPGGQAVAPPHCHRHLLFDLAALRRPRCTKGFRQLSVGPPCGSLTTGSSGLGYGGALACHISSPAQPGR